MQKNNNFAFSPIDILSTLPINFSEDSRISKLLKRLSREEDYEHFLGLCKQVQESIVAPENQRYIRRHMDNICECLVETLLSGPGLEAKSQIAKCLGRIGYIVDQDFKRYIFSFHNKYLQIKIVY